MKCQLLSYMVPERPDVGISPAKSVTRCQTHDWTFDGVASVMCPIGRIEDATTSAFRAIDLATDDAITAITSVFDKG